MAATQAGLTSGPNTFMTSRTYADENDQTPDGRYMLNIVGSLRDIERYKAELRPGIRVVFNVQDEFEVQGTLEYDSETKMWLGRSDYGKF